MTDKWASRYWIKPELGRYYKAIIQQNLFDEWELIRVWGALEGGHGQVKIQYCASYAEAAELLESTSRRRRYRGYERVQ